MGRILRDCRRIGVTYTALDRCATNENVGFVLNKYEFPNQCRIGKPHLGWQDLVSPDFVTVSEATTRRTTSDPNFKGGNHVK